MNSFQNRYITKGIQHEVPVSTQLYLWSLIDCLKQKTDMELDYLQVFELSGQGNAQQIVHKQEVPPYKQTHLISSVEIIKAKIFVIDSVEYTTMLLASEY